MSTSYFSLRRVVASVTFSGTLQREDVVYSESRLGLKEREMLSASCRCCQENIPVERPRIWPECGHDFKGNGRDGIDAHWRAKHEQVMSYEAFWEGLCPEHKR